MVHTGRYRLKVIPPVFWQTILDPRVIEDMLPSCCRFARLDDREYEGIWALSPDSGSAYATIRVIVGKDGDHADIDIQIAVGQQQICEARLSVVSIATASGMTIKLETSQYCSATSPVEETLAVMDAHITALLWRIERFATSGTIHIMNRTARPGKPVWTAQTSLGLSRNLRLRRL